MGDDMTAELLQENYTIIVPINRKKRYCVLSLKESFNRSQGHEKYIFKKIKIIRFVIVYIILLEVFY